MHIKSKNFMSEKLSSNKFEYDEFNMNSEESDYKSLIIRLKDISKTIVLLEKTTYREI